MLWSTSTLDLVMETRPYLVFVCFHPCLYLSRCSYEGIEARVLGVRTIHTNPIINFVHTYSVGSLDRISVRVTYIKGEILRSINESSSYQGAFVIVNFVTIQSMLNHQVFSDCGY